MVATAPIRKHEKIVAAPSHMIIDHETILKNDSKLKTLWDKAKLNDLRRYVFFNERAIIFTLWLLANRYKATFWSPWFAVLPTKLFSPLLLSEEDFHLLNGSGVQFLSAQLRKEAQATYWWLNETIFSQYREQFPSNTTTYQHFSWAYTIYRTRNFMEGLVPVADFFNHHPRIHTASYGWDDDERAFVVRASHDAKPGDEVFITYKGGGAGLTNAALWFYYGFFMPGEATESFSLLYEPDILKQIYSPRPKKKKDRFLYDKIAILNERKLLSRKLYTITEIEIDPRLLWLLRVLNAKDKKSLNTLQTFNPMLCPLRGLFPLELEKSVMTQLLAIFSRQLAAYPTRLIDDEYVLYTASEELTTEKYLITLLLRAEKSLLSQYIEALKEAMRQIRLQSRWSKIYRPHSPFVVDELQIDRFGNCTKFG